MDKLILLWNGKDIDRSFWDLQLVKERLAIRVKCKESDYWSIYDGIYSKYSDQYDKYVVIDWNDRNLVDQGFLKETLINVV